MRKCGFQKKMFILLKNGVFNQHNTPPPNSEVKPGLIRSFSKIETEQENILMPVLTRNTNLNQKK